MTTYIKDIFDLPDRVHRGDFVLRLTEGLSRAEETVKDYVVTKQLAEAFDQALSLIRSSIDQRSSKAAYLHGSFGSGKSHFMAVLNLLLQNNIHARSIPELAEVVVKHNEWTASKKFLLVPYHMIGSKDMESSILGGYVEHIKLIHPEASTPGLFRAEELFKDAQNLRASMGDKPFFEKLNKGRVVTNSTEWGDVEEGWNATSFERAFNAPVKSEERQRLIGNLMDSFFTAFKIAGDYVDLDSGLSVISKHAKALGYDTVILFLDELILWLATHAADVSFVSNEGSKLAKLVESQSADRPIPIISFVARQRDLKDLIGDNVTGAVFTSFSDTLKWWEARFSKITLEDRNLPAIAEKRVLRLKEPVSVSRELLDQAFKQATSIREEAMNTLLTSQSNLETFRRLYPFSPALVETLVAVSFWLQRERTALKVMLQLLVEQKDRLKLGQIIPVGDLFDLISEGDEAYSNDVKIHFDNAKKLYYEKLRPILERDHNLSFEQLDRLPYEDPKGLALRNDDRLVKTLLLSALASNVESLRGLTAGRLAALNQGTIQSPVQGRETSIVLQKCRRWAAECGQIKIGDESIASNTSITIQLTGVDTESIINQVQHEDSHGNRVLKIKELLFEELGIKQEDELFQRHEFIWRATKRSCDLIFTNVRDLPDQSLVNTSEDWKIIIDYPFDTENHGPRDDIARLQRFQHDNEQSSRTIIWIPLFFSLEALKELGTLVKLDYLLAGERLSNCVSHLTIIERSDARSLLENQRSQLRQRVKNYLEGLYGVAKPTGTSINRAHELTPSEIFQTLDQSFSLQPPAAANLRQAFDNLLDQALKHQYPGHPLFENNTTLNIPTLKRVYEAIERASQIPDNRLAVDPGPLRKELKQIIGPLRLGEMYETHLLLSKHWLDHFNRKEAEYGLPITVERMRDWIDMPQPMGLMEELQNLIIMAFAVRTNRSFFRYGRPFSASIDNLPNDLELKEQSLPSSEDWKEARHRGAAILDISSSELLNASNVSNFVAQVRKQASEYLKPCKEFHSELLNRLELLKVETNIAPRWQTSLAAKNLMEAIAAARDEDIVNILATARIETSESSMKVYINRAAELLNELKKAKWFLIERAVSLQDERAKAGQIIWKDLQEAIRQDEYAVVLAPALHNIEERAAKLLADMPKTEPTAVERSPSTLVNSFTKDPTRTVPIAVKKSREDITSSNLDELMESLKQELERSPKARLRVSWEVYE
jgi:hypothetical protein